ncbi:MAG: hypothetical protein D6748_14190 [Calditrichaeota bacterium]|nr:MAG: hypothetical protein D6748_14190 [Calditrichota bacterium]
MAKREYTPREKILMALAFGGSALFLIIKVVFIPLYSDWQEQNQTIDQLRAQYVKTLSSIRQAESQLEPSTAKEESKGEAPIAAFLKDIESTAGKHILIRRFQPLQTSAFSNSRNAAGTRSLQVQIDCQGTLSDLLRFFKALESRFQLTRIRHFYLTPSGKGEQLQCQLIIVRLLNV